MTKFLEQGSETHVPPNYGLEDQWLAEHGNGGLPLELPPIKRGQIPPVDSLTCAESAMHQTPYARALRSLGSMGLRPADVYPCGVPSVARPQFEVAVEWWMNKYRDRRQS